MLLKTVYDEALAHASYVVGCQRSGEAVVVDPGRNIAPYLELAQRHRLRITAVAETHIHADYVSGARELADRLQAMLYVSDEGPPAWKYEYASEYRAQLLHDGDTFRIGNIRFEVMHTPGHTPESISFLLTDEGSGADQPMGIFTGDFVFVGSIGRPDLLEEAAGLAGTAEPGARDLYRSLQRFRALPDFLQVWPAHGAGSACGKGLGAIPSSTVGYEKLFNPALQIHDEQEFVDYILAEQPEAPTYFAVMKRVNKEGPAVLGPATELRQLDSAGLPAAIEAGQVVDLNTSDQFAQAHVPGSINIPLPSLAAWAGWLLDYGRPVWLVGGRAQMADAVQLLQKIGVDHVEGYFDGESLWKAGLKSQSFPTASPEQLRAKIASGELVLIDVRNQQEWNAGHIEQARHMFLGKLPRCVDELRGHQVVAQCQLGGRSAIAASVLQAAGVDVINMTGGIQAWIDSGLNTVTAETVCIGSTARTG